MNAHVRPSPIDPMEGSQTAEILRLAKQGVKQKQIAAQTGSDYYYVGVTLWNLRRRGLLEQPQKNWSDEELEALREATVDKGMKGTAAAAYLSQKFGKSFNRNQVVQVTLRRAWKAESFWDRAENALREAVVDRRMSASDAAAHLTTTLGRTVTKNMVISKARRLGLELQGETGRPPRDKTRKEVARRETPRRAAPRTKTPVDGWDKPGHDAGKMEAAPPPIEWEPRRLTLLELREGDCRFPLGDPRGESFAFCGAPTEVGKPYCAHCAGVAYDTPAQRAEVRRKWRAARGLAVEA
jgi:GcrA cell cycle regulator